ncbi:SUKH-3 domain-containing protein [Paraflavitalea sp. CAU 1676]|uniref:SUKH-3 domain-containing protein n=1 Tax=Paraflavitalea sp. CAU 1676 TaxID=3032598 RepID=UPI0023DC6E82|nr:SUKH-3 domain-containing protein [Paraflavitalea sp. CAU 1676]MDF2191610.1 SUKH-3 domain-containing protein [Paraflavitalea sp. CAU 1676]
MDDLIKELLDSAGWYENRSINIEYEIEDLSREGFSLPNEKVILLWKEFWNLRIEFALPSGEFSDIVLNVDRGRRCTDPDDVKKMEAIVGKQLVPAGLLHFETGLLLIALDLSFYMVAEGGVYQLGASFEEFLDNTIRRKDILKYNY